MRIFTMAFWNKTRTRAFLYGTAAFLTYVATNLTVGMFGDGTLDWAHFRFEWVKLSLGSILAVVIVLRSFADGTSARQQLSDKLQNGNEIADHIV